MTPKKLKKYQTLEVHLRSIEYRFYPTYNQIILLEKIFGCVRFLWNLRVQKFNSYDKNAPKVKDQSIKELKVLFPFLAEVPYNALDQKDWDFRGFKNQFFNKKRKVKLGRPNFKKKGINDSFRLNDRAFRIKEGCLHLAKLGECKIKGSIPINELPNIRSMTIKRKGSVYLIKVLYMGFTKPKPTTGNAVGIDLGLKHFYTDNQGNKVENPKFLEKSLNKIKRLNKALSRAKLGSNNRNKIKNRLADVHFKVQNQRKHFLHNVTNDLVANNDVICIETLVIKDLVKKKGFGRKIHDASWSKFGQYLDYKCRWHNRQLIKIDQWFPSTKKCSSCGYKLEEIPLDVREWSCPSCGELHDRDINAAINILTEGLRLLPSKVISEEYPD